jgi:hypothetical protein
MIPVLEQILKMVSSFTNLLWQSESVNMSTHVQTHTPVQHICDGMSSYYSSKIIPSK